MRIMVVEDEEQIREIIAAMLKARFRDCEIESFGSPEDALECAAAQQFDVIITDYRMAPIDGARLIERLRTTASANRKTPVIMCSGYGDDLLMDLGERWDDLEFVDKPISPEQLYQKISAILDV